jgi:hypothetical protein
MRQRSGVALVEALLVATLLSLVAAGGTAVLRAQTRIAGDVTTRSERNDAARAVLLTLRAELYAVEPRTDLRAHTRDSIATRVFRGVAIVCGHRDSLTFMRYRGLRLPDATKDSALQLGVENVVAIGVSAAQGASCVHLPNEQVLSLHLSAHATLGSMWILFETGTYELSSNALRYHRDGDVRQPLTNEVIDVTRSGFYFQADSVVRGIQVEVTDRRTGDLARGWIRLANGS